MSLATISRQGRAAFAKSISKCALHLAWGTGDPEWDAMPEGNLPSLIEATALVSEIGRRLITVKTFVEPDEAGDIVVPTGLNPDGTSQLSRYRQVEHPTPFLYLRVNYDYDDASMAVIREMAVFVDAVTDPALPPGQFYFTPGDVLEPGLYLTGQIIRPAINRSPSVRQSIEFVLPI